MKTIWPIGFPDITVVSEYASAGILEMQLLYLPYKVIFNINVSLVSKMKLSPFLYWIDNPLVIFLVKI